MESDECVEDESLNQDDNQSDGEKVSMPSNKLKKKLHKKGVVYLTRIPTGMTVTKLSEILNNYGELGRIYLKPEERESKKRGRAYTEGWVEFERKRVAKLVVGTLNNTNVPGKRKNPWFEELWNMKYLKQFKWNDLALKIKYEEQAKQKSVETAVPKAKEEVDKFVSEVKRDKLFKKLVAAGKQRPTYDASSTKLKMMKPFVNKNDPRAKGSDKSFLKGLFANGMK